MSETNSSSGEAPRAFREFAKRFPGLADAWNRIREAEASGPIDRKTRRLIKLAVSIAARSTGATHSATRKALEAGATHEEIYQVVALAAGGVGMPGAVAAFTWVEDILRESGTGTSSSAPLEIE
jgi:alkylhydroperoxidase/carboxymuconolactone decarboxylase family protein YurZ